MIIIKDSIKTHSHNRNDYIKIDHLHNGRRNKQTNKQINKNKRKNHTFKKPLHVLQGVHT